jgi:hypothetical protein
MLCRTIGMGIVSLLVVAEVPLGLENRVLFYMVYGYR